MKRSLLRAKAAQEHGAGGATARPLPRFRGGGNRRLSSQDRAATATAFTAESIAAAYRDFILDRTPIAAVLVAGGGALNPTLLRMIAQRLPAGIRVTTTAAFGVPTGPGGHGFRRPRAMSRSWGGAGNLPAVTGAQDPRRPWLHYPVTRFRYLMRRRHLMKKLSVFLVAFALMGFIGRGRPFAATAPKVLTIGVDQEAVGIDPHIVTAFSSMRRIDLMYNHLVRLDDNLAVVPDLAESWDIPNNLTYVFHLRQGSSSTTAAR